MTSCAPPAPTSSSTTSGSWRHELADRGRRPRRAARESIFAIGNGYLGVRGAAEEGAPSYDAGTVLNGFYESWPIVYPEDAYGLARTGQTIVAPPDGSIVRLLVDGEPLDVTTARVSRVLDMRVGVLRREVELETPSGARLLVRSRRLASLVRRNLVAIDYEGRCSRAPRASSCRPSCGPTRRPPPTTTRAATRASPSGRSIRWRPRRSARAWC
jgi:trehalose/maltose hydrolase-like predicted phosphorylase